MERSLPYDVNIEDVLAELLEYMDDRNDVVDSETGPSPNKEMTFSLEIRQALFQIAKQKNKPTEKDFFTGMPFERKDENKPSLNFDVDPPVIGDAYKSHI